MTPVVAFTYRPPRELYRRLRHAAFERHLSVNKLLTEMLTAQLDYWAMLEAGQVETGNGDQVVLPRLGAHISMWGSGHTCGALGPHDGPCVCACGAMQPYDGLAGSHDG